MTWGSQGVALVLLASLALGLLRVLRGPTRADRMLAAQLVGTTGAAILLVLSRSLGSALLDVALVFALLAPVAAAAFARAGVAS